MQRATGAVRAGQVSTGPSVGFLASDRRPASHWAEIPTHANRDE